MILTAIYNVFDGEELLEGSINQIYKHLDRVILLYQDVSNYGEAYDGGKNECLRLQEKYEKVEAVHCLPSGKNPMQKETNKRAYGLSLLGNSTHFMFMDCDEYYNENEFKEAKERIYSEGIEGSVCKIQAYYKYPTCMFEELEKYYVPFIHKNSIGVSNKSSIRYPFHVDPTRKTNAKDVQEIDIIMHHYSWVRKDIKRKIRNSTARKNIEKSTMLHDYVNLKEGVDSTIHGRKVIFTDNRHGIKIENIQL